MVGGASRDRTDDLIVANSEPCPGRRDTEEVQIARRGSVHAGLRAVPCPSVVPERHSPTPSDMGMDRGVTTQVTTQNPVSFPLPARQLSRGYPPHPRLVYVPGRVQKKF